jgi:hypothetical protein
VLKPIWRSGVDSGIPYKFNRLISIGFVGFVKDFVVVFLRGTNSAGLRRTEEEHMLPFLDAHRLAVAQALAVDGEAFLPRRRRTLLFGSI